MHAAGRLHVPPEAALPLEKAGALVAGKTSAAAEGGRGEELSRAAFPGPSPCRRGGEPAPLPPMKGGPAESGSPRTNPARLRWVWRGQRRLDRGPTPPAGRPQPT